MSAFVPSSERALGGGTKQNGTEWLCWQKLRAGCDGDGQQGRQWKAGVYSA